MELDLAKTDPVAAMLAHLDRTMPDAHKVRADRIEKMNSVYVTSWRDALFTELKDELVINARASLRGLGDKDCALFVIGDSGSGKSTMIEHHLRKSPEFQSFRVGDDLMRPVISFEAPKPCSAPKLAAAAASALGLDIRVGDRDEEKLFLRLNERLLANGTLFMHIDEAQHAIRFRTEHDIKRVQDIIKSMLQVKGWPLHAILSGTRDLEDLIVDNEQLPNRRQVLYLDPLTFAEHGGDILDIVERIATVHADLKPVEILEGEFIHRLMRAVSYQFGSIIQLVRKGCSNAIADGSDSVDPSHFAKAYHKANGCMEAHNFFIAKDWHLLRPGKLRQPDPQEEVAKTKRKGKS